MPADVKLRVLRRPQPERSVPWVKRNRRLRPKLHHKSRRPSFHLAATLCAFFPRRTPRFVLQRQRVRSSTRWRLHSAWNREVDDVASVDSVRRRTLSSWRAELRSLFSTSHGPHSVPGKRDQRRRRESHHRATALSRG